MGKESELAKSLQLINGKSILERQCRFFYEKGFQNFLILLGHKSEEIILHIKEINSKLGIEIKYTIEDLDFNFDYVFKVCAYSELGIGKPAVTNKIKLKKPLIPPSKPENIRTRRVANGEITVEWSKPSSTGGSNITFYIVEVLEIVAKLDTLDDSLEGFEWIQYDECSSYTFDYTIKNLKVGGMYSIRVAAENTIGRSAYSEINEPVIAKDMFCKCSFIFNI